MVGHSYIRMARLCRSRQGDNAGYRKLHLHGASPNRFTQFQKNCASCRLFWHGLSHFWSSHLKNTELCLFLMPVVGMFSYRCHGLLNLLLSSVVRFLVRIWVFTHIHSELLLFQASHRSFSHFEETVRNTAKCAFIFGIRQLILSTR